MGRSARNHRGINFLSIPAKLFKNIILERLQTAFDPYLREKQPGFQVERSCIDLIFNLHMMLDESKE